MQVPYASIIEIKEFCQLMRDMSRGCRNNQALQGKNKFFKKTVLSKISGFTSYTNSEYEKIGNDHEKSAL